MRRNPISRLLTGRTLRLLFLLLVLVEAFFTAESLETLIGIVVGNGGTVADLLLLLALNLPEVVDFALPLAILIGLYFAISAARDDNELVVCAAAGVPWRRIPGFALRIGVAGCFASILFAGFLTPIAKYAQRIAIYTIESRRILEEINDPSPRSSLRITRDRTFIVTPPDTVDSKRGGLFIFEEDKGKGWRASKASDWAVEGPTADAAYSVKLLAFHDYREYRSVSDPEASPSQELAQQLEFAKIRVQRLSFDFNLREMIRAVNRAHEVNERVLVGPAGLRGGNTRIVDRNFAEIMARAMLCVFAASVAVAAVAWSGTRQGRLFALPVALVLVLGMDVAARALLGDAGASGPAWFWPAFVLFGTVSTALPMTYVSRRREGIIAPGRSRG